MKQTLESSPPFKFELFNLLEEDYDDKMVNMEFDGKAVSVPEGMTLVDAAATVGIHIPNLCHIKELRGVGACRMCMVEIEGMKTPVTGCTTRTKEGMKVQTKTAEGRGDQEVRDRPGAVLPSRWTA